MLFFQEAVTLSRATSWEGTTYENLLRLRTRIAVAFSVPGGRNVPFGLLSESIITEFLNKP